MYTADMAADVKPRTGKKFGKRGFHFAGPDTWNRCNHIFILLLILQLLNVYLTV